MNAKRGEHAMKELLVRHMGNYEDRTVTITTASSVANALIGSAKLALGIYLLSPWFMANAIYYLLLCAARGLTLKKYQAAKQIENKEERVNWEFTVYQRSGVFICLMGIAYLLVCLRMYFTGDSTVYKGHIAYGVAAVAFTKLGFAIYGTSVARHLHNPIISLLKTINFTDAFVSIVVTECTLLTMQGIENATIYSAITGMVFSALFIAMGILMLAKKKKHPLNCAGDSIDAADWR